MTYKRYKFWYFNFLLLFFTLIFNNIYILLILFIWKLMFLFNLYSDTYIEFFHPVQFADYYNIDNKYVETDHEDPDFYIMFYQEFYSLCNCRFSFDIFGGHQTLDDNDFIDVPLYSDNRNFKNIYKNNNFKYTTKTDYILYYFDNDNILHYKFNYKIKKGLLDNINKYNIDNNLMLKNMVLDGKRITLFKIFKNNNKYKNE